MTPAAGTTGASLRKEREAAGLTQGRLAQQVGVSRFTLILWEGRAVVSADKAARYLRAVAELAEAGK